MTEMLKKTTAVLLFSAIALFSASCSKSEELRQRALPEAPQTVSETVTEETKEPETEEITTTAKTTAETTVTTTTSTTTSTTTTTTAPAATTTAAPPATTAKTAAPPPATTAAPTPVTTTTVRTTAPPPPPPVTTTTTVAPPAPAPSESMADQVFRLVNQIRAEYGLPAYKRLDSLTGAAQKRADEISVYYSHTRPSGKSSIAVFAEYGLNYSYAGENIAAGQKTAQQVVNDWMGSTMGHREAILSPDYQYLGVGCVELHSNDIQGYRYYWTQEFFTPL